jgi:thioredoxin 1
MEKLNVSTRTVTGATLESTINENAIVVLDFWAAWCGPCRRFAPVFEEASVRHADVVFGKVDTEAEQQIAAELRIESIPTLMVFRDQILLFRQPGALPAGALEDLLQQVKKLDMDEVRAELAKAKQEDASSVT